MSAEAHEYEVAVGGASLRCRSVGHGSALVWAHALLSNMDHEDQAPIFDWSELAHRGQRWVRYDARGHGESSEEHHAGHLEWPNLARDLLAVADQSQLRSFAAGGASMGCATALWCAHIAPDRVQRLVLALPPTAWERRGSQATIYRAVALTAQLRLTLPLHLAQRYVPRRSEPATRAGYLRSSLAPIAAAAPVQMAAALRGAATSDLPPLDSVAGIGVPTLILAWPRDRSHPLDVARTLADTLPNATLHVAGDDDAIRRWPELVGDFLAGL